MPLYNSSRVAAILAVTKLDVLEQEAHRPNPKPACLLSELELEPDRTPPCTKIMCSPHLSGLRFRACMLNLFIAHRRISAVGRHKQRRPRSPDAAAKPPHANRSGQGRNPQPKSRHMPNPHHATEQPGQSKMEGGEPWS
jgi:hypothetical protein